MKGGFGFCREYRVRSLSVVAILLMKMDFGV